MATIRDISTKMDDEYVYPQSLAHKPVWIEELPEEILAMIIDQIPSEDRATYWALSLTNRLFHRLTVKGLYARYDLLKGYCGSSTMNFFRTILEGPSLASYVRHIELGSDISEAQSCPIQARSELAAHLKQLKAADRQWVRGLEGGPRDEEIALALIILQTPNITNLDVTIHDPDRSQKYAPPMWILPIVKGLSHGKFHGFKFLKSVSINMSGIQLCAISPIFQVPSLRILELICLRDDKPWICQEDSSPIEALSFVDCNISKASIEIAIKGCRSLKSFVLEDNWAEDWWLAACIETLRKHKTSLTHLHLEKFNGWGHESESSDSVSSFEEFTKLRHLLCPLGLLMRADVDENQKQDLSLVKLLPPSLNFLCLWLSLSSGDIPQLFMRLLKEFATTYKHFIPDLNVINIEAYLRRDHDSVDWKAVQQALREESKATHRRMHADTTIVKVEKGSRTGNGSKEVAWINRSNDVASQMFHKYSQKFVPGMEEQE